MKKRIFYSWQSDLPNNTNRGFINNALEKAIKEITSSDAFTLVPFLDRDTMGEAGSPDISTTIFNKIKNSSIFICDVSIINSSENPKRATPNPNVLIELGYAISELGWEKIILIMNSSYGKVETLPFDLRGRKILTYEILPNSEDKAAERKRISSILKNGIIEILQSIIQKSKKVKKTTPIKKTNSLKLEAKRELRLIKNISSAVQKRTQLNNAIKKYLKLERYDLVVDFALELSSAHNKRTILTKIAKLTMKSGDVDTAEKAISGITNTQTRNSLSKQLLKKINTTKA